MKRRKPYLRKQYRPVLRSQADVHAMWQRLICPLGWHSRRLYLIVIAPDGRPSTIVHEFGSDLISPQRDHIETWMACLSRSIDDLRGSVRIALLYCRPGGYPADAEDRQMCRELYAAARRHQVLLEVVHLGHDLAITPMPMDDVLAA